MDSLQVLPFYNLNDGQFNIVNGLWSVRFNQLIETDLFNLISNPDKSDEADPDLILTIPMSNYYSISQLNNSVTKAGPKAISMFHFNIRSLQKNLALLEDFLYSLDKRPEILAITETRLNANSVCNVDLLNFIILIHLLWLVGQLSTSLRLLILYPDLIGRSQVTSK